MSYARIQPDPEDTPDFPSELDIVDTFTRLIFGEKDLTARELSTIAALRAVDDNIAMDGVSEMGAYLRALGVPEMIVLVRRVRDQLGREWPAADLQRCVEPTRAHP